MAYLALYRRYRPTTFDNLIGQEHIVKTLVNQIQGNRLGHAYLFTGTRGTGKTSAAKIFAKAINCLNPVNGSPCGECEVCMALSDSSNIDVVEIDAASNNGVNEIRDLREKVQYPPVSCRYKVYIIDEVHMLTGAAFNALLKTLEEPPKHAVFILATTEVHKIPATILSRCMRFDFRLISTERIAELISKIYDEQGKKYQKEAVFAIAKAGEGSIRDALSIADIAISYGTGELTYNDVTEILGSSNTELLTEFIANVISGESGRVLDIIEQLCSLGKSIGVLTKDVTMILRDLLVAKTCAKPNDILGLPENRFAIIKSISDSTSENRLLRILEIFSDMENSLKYTNHPRVVFETASFKATRPETDYNVDALISRISTLENKIQALTNGEVVVKTVVAENKALSTDNVSKESVQVENKKEVKPIDNKDEVKNLQSISLEDLKGKLLFRLRQIGSEMLWNVIQTVSIEVKGNILKLTTDNNGDFELLNKDASKNRIREALNDFDGYEIEVNLSELKKSLDAIDEATERVKQIFGNDIVIIK